MMRRLRPSSPAALVLAGGLFIGGAGLAWSQPPERAAPGGKAAALLTEAEALLSAGNAEKAIGVLERAKRIQRDDPDVLIAYARALRATSRLDEARESLHAVLKLRAASPPARRLLGEVYLDLAAEQLATLRSAGPDAKDDAAGLLAACNGLPERVRPPEKK